LVITFIIFKKRIGLRLWDKRVVKRNSWLSPHHLIARIEFLLLKFSITIFWPNGKEHHTFIPYTLLKNKGTQKEDKGHHTSIPYTLPKSNKSGQRERLVLKEVQSAKEN
jgi:hypothetical protein